jgi:hypothetical protein
VKLAVIPVAVAMMGPDPSGERGCIEKSPFQVTFEPALIFTQFGEYCIGAAVVGNVIVASPVVSMVALGSHPFTPVPEPPAAVLPPHAVKPAAPAKQATQTMMAVLIARPPYGH